MPTSSGSGHHHRSGSLRQTNKKNKRSKSSKRSLTKAAGGKITGKSAHHQNTILQTKADRRHHQVQLREAKKQERLRRLRGWVATSNDTSQSSSELQSSSAQRPPRVVGILSLGSSPGKMEEQVRSFLLQGADVTYPSDWATTSNLSTVSSRYLAHKKDGALTILTNSTAFAPNYKLSTSNTSVGDDDEDDVAVLAALDLCRVCDMILFVIDDDDSNTSEEKEEIMNMNIGCGNSSTGRSHSASTIGQEWDHLISARGDKVLAAIKAQGLPTPLTVLAHTKEVDDDDDNMTFQSAKSLNRSAVKRRQALKRFANRFALTEFGTDGSKVLEVDLAATFPKNTDDAGDIDDDDRMEGVDDDERTALTGAGGGASMTTSKAERQSQMAAAAFIRTVCTMAASPPKWVSELPRPYLLADRYTYDDTIQELKLTGHVRGRVPLSVNSLFHIPNMGTFQCKSISNASESHGLFKQNRTKKALNAAVDKDVITPNPELQENLTMFATPDALEGEQNLIGFDEADEDIEDINDIEAEHNDNDFEKPEKFARPAGWSDYQSAWLDGVDNEDDDNPEGTVGPGDFDHGELAKELNQPGRRIKGIDSAANSVFAADQMDLDEANQVTKEERSALLEQRRKDQSEHLSFPDEVQVNEDENARDRFARYRALKSFKKTFWDPKENLPESYSSIFHFASFKATQSNIIKDMKDKVKAANSCSGLFWGGRKRREAGNTGMDEDDDDESDDILEGCVPVGAYVTVTLKVPKESFVSVDSNAALAAVALLQHENKVSVLHMGLNRPAGFVETGKAPIKSKDLLTFRCGWRTWQGRPIFSQNNINCDKHKFERFLPTEGSFFAASVFGPVTYTPCPVLVFRSTREHDSTKHQLVSMGSMIGADADRIIIKRIVLTGFPVKVQKRFATVKYMFYNPDDVRWFKPADLTTKHGLNGNIMESVGEHGTMKCLFNAPIKQHDTVCLQMYKRVYPKFVGASDGEGSDRVSVRTSSRNQKLLVW